MAILRICSIEGCGKEVDARGWCVTHYTNARRRGDPLKGPTRAPNNSRLRWLREHASHQGDNCLFWPMPHRCGYPNLRIDGADMKAHRLMCALAHGEPPDVKMQAAHSCGRGHDGCLNPRHLRWATVVENSADRIAHGTANRGERHGANKLTEANARFVLANRHQPAQYLANRFGVSRATIHRVWKGECWAWLSEGAL